MRTRADTSFYICALLILVMASHSSTLDLERSPVDLEVSRVLR